jgi:hypothetical protein
MLALKITTNSDVEKIDVQEPLHKTIRDVLGGYLEVVHPKRLPEPYCMIVDEEGIIKELELNPVGCYLYETDIHRQPIVGDIILMREKMTVDGILLDGLRDSDVDFLMKDIGRLIKFFKQHYKCVKEGAN